MIGSSKNNRENFPRKCFWTQEKETWVKFNPGVSTNRPSNNWAWAQNTTHHKIPLPSLQETGFGLTASQEAHLLYTVGDSLYLNPKIVLHFIPTGSCSIEHNIHNFIIFENFLYVKWCKIPVKFLLFPLENLGVAPVLQRSSSQTLYLCVGVKRGVSPTLRCDLQMKNNSYQAQHI